MSAEVTFGVFSDLHLDIMHDGARRLRAFLSAMRGEPVEFVIQLGDFCYPEDTARCDCSEENLPVNLRNAMRVPAEVPKRELLAAYGGFEKPAYHVLGNHEFDFCSKERAMALYGMRSRYYSFHAGGWRFLVLDGNHFRDREGRVAPYRYGDYFDSADLPYLDGGQLAWLERELLGDGTPTVLFCHQPMDAGPRGLRNAAELHRLFARANRGERVVYACLNGHTHVDALREEGGIVYYTVNSISNHWVGTDYCRVRYDGATEAAFPNLRYTLPYADPVFAVVTLDARGMRVRGRRGRFVPPGAHELGLPASVTAGIVDRDVPWPDGSV